MSPTSIPGNLILKNGMVAVNDQRNPPGDAQITYGITSTGGTFNLRSTGTVDYEVEWGDGTVERSTSNVLAHTYAAGNYVLKIRTSQAYVPYFSNSTDEDQITSVALVSDLDVGNSLVSAWWGANNMTTFDAAFGVTTGVTNFSYAWRGCSSLTRFPELDTSSATSFVRAWLGCSSLTRFPELDTSSATDFSSAWLGCSSLTNFSLLDASIATTVNQAWSNCYNLTTFPQINFPLVTDFYRAWLNCTSLTSFPQIDISSGTRFIESWRGCTSLTSFPANFFDSWTGTPSTNCFAGAWDNCTSLTATSVENILNSIDTSGQTAPGVGPDITIDYNASTGTPNITTAVSNLKSRGWTITLNGTPQ